MSKQSDSRLVLGGPPRVDLLPPEIKQGKKAAGVRRQLAIGVIAVIVLSAAGYGVAAIQALNAATALTREQDETLRLQTEMNKFADARNLDIKINSVKAAYMLGSYTEIDWLTMLRNLTKDLPSGAGVELTITTSTPIESIPQPVDALSGPRQASVIVLVKTKKIFTAADYIRDLEKLPGYVNTTVSSLNWVSDDGLYETGFTVFLNEGAFADRFVDGVLVNDPNAKPSSADETIDDPTDTDDTTDGTENTDGTDTTDGTESTED